MSATPACCKGRGPCQLPTGSALASGCDREVIGMDDLKQNDVAVSPKVFRVRAKTTGQSMLASLDQGPCLTPTDSKVFAGMITASG